MEPSHPLKALLQFQLATDAYSVLHLPYVLSTLTQEALLPSSHLPKWTTRINSLLHSKDAGARAGVGTPEYQRQVATPNIPKFTAAIIPIVDKNTDEELRILILETLARLVPVYPTLYRASHTALSALSLRFLDGSAPNPTRNSLLNAASSLYSVLHFTGGKVGAANLWRKSVDETLAFGWNAFLALRTTFPNDGPNGANSPNIDDALIGIPLNLDRLRSCTVVLCNLLSSTTHRPVQLPLGPLIKFISALLSCTKDDRGKEHADLAIHSMEISIISDFWKFGCELTTCLASCARQHLTPNLTRLISFLTYHLEQKPTPAQRLFFLTTVQALLKHCHLLDSPLVPTRLAKAVLPSLSVVLASPAEIQAPDDTPASQKSKKGKKRARGYEGDEVFKLSREVICPGPDEGKALFAAVEVMRLVLRNPNLSSAMQSISVRVLLSILLTLPQISPASLSSNLRLHSDLLQLVQSINTELGSGTTSVMSKSLGIVVRATIIEDDNEDTLRDLEILLHPRVPPLVRSLPHVESLSLFRAEEPQEEADVREEIGLHGALPDQPTNLHEEDVVMHDSIAHITQAPPLNHLQPKTVDERPSPAPPVASPSLVTQQPLGPATMSKASAIEQPQMKPPVPKSTPQPVVPPPVQVPVAQEVDDEDEEMPAINMDSDSDEY
ncbi:hypothetical protein H0H87_007958 [Tephrocybe sp. NHM501043]|nr:hypothetical protein H0H87_007958 [Tephrocybe sp. NHM501043]